MAVGDRRRHHRFAPGFAARWRTLSVFEVLLAFVVADGAAALSARIEWSLMVLNDYLPKMEIDAQTYEVRADGVLLTCEPASVLPMAQRYFLF